MEDNDNGQRQVIDKSESKSNIVARPSMISNESESEQSDSVNESE